MPVRWFFTTDPETGFVELIARAEGEGGLIGDARDIFRPGDASTTTPGLTYDVLAEAGSGTLVIDDDGTFRFLSG